MYEEKLAKTSLTTFTFEELLTSCVNAINTFGNAIKTFGKQLAHLGDR